MSDNVIIALITASVTLAVNLLANWSDRKKLSLKQAVRDQEIKDKLNVLEKKVDIHNGYAKRFGEIEKAIVRIDTKLEVQKERRAK